MKIIKRIELPNGINLLVIKFGRVIAQKKLFNSCFITGLEVDGKLYFSEEKQYKYSLKDCTDDVLNHLSLYNQGVDLRQFYPKHYLFQKPFIFSKIKKELKKRFQIWLAKDALLKQKYN